MVIELLYYAATAFLLLLQYLDYVSTKMALAEGNGEGNPLIALFMKYLGDKWWIGKSALVIVFVGSFVYYGPQPATWVWLGVLIPLYTWAVVSNINLSKK